MKQGLHIASEGTQYWYRNGHFHNLNGPAIIYTNGATSYYINGFIYEKEDWETTRQNLIIQENLESLL